MKSVKRLNIGVNMLWSEMGSMVYLFFQWLTNIILLRSTGSYEDVGIYALGITISSNFLIIAGYSVRTYQISDISGKYNDGTYIRLRLLTCTASMIGCCVFVLIMDFTAVQKACVLFYTLYKLSEALADVFHGIDQNADRMDIVGKSHVFRGIFMTTVFSIIIALTKSLLLSILGMCMTVYVIIFVYDIPRAKALNIQNITKLRKHTIRDLLIECFPLFISNLIINIIISSPRYLLNIYHGEEALGIYSSVAFPTMVLQASATFILVPLMPLFTRACVSGNSKQFKKVFLISLSIILAILALGTFGALLFGEFGLGLLFGESIIQHAHILIPLVISSVLSAATWLISAVLTATRNFKGLIISTSISALLAIVLYPSFIKLYDMNGASFAMSLVQALAVALMSGFVILDYVKRFT